MKGFFDFITRDKQHKRLNNFSPSAWFRSYALVIDCDYDDAATDHCAAESQEKILGGY